MKKINLLLAILVLFILIGCNGGGDGSNSETNTASRKITFNPDFSEIIINFNENTISGLSQQVNLSDIVHIQWNSDRVGWRNQSIAYGKIVSSGGKYSATINRIPHNDIGNISVLLTNGSFIWLSYSQWKIIGAELTRDNLLKYGTYSKPELLFSTNHIAVEFNDTMLIGLSEYGIDPSDVEWVQWNSDRVGWDGQSTATAPLEKNMQTGFFSAYIEIPNNDIGVLSLILEDGTEIWFSYDQWDISNAILTEDDELEYGNYSQSDLAFENGHITINFNTDIICGISNFGIDPSAIQRVQWSSDKVGWRGNSSAYSIINKDAEGNYYAEISIPSHDSGNLSLLMKNGSVVYFVYSRWDISGATYNNATGLIDY